MGNEQSKQKTLGQNLGLAAKATGVAVAGILISPFAIVALPFITPYQLASENKNPTTPRVVADVVLGVIAGALIAPFLPLILPVLGVIKLFNETPLKVVVSDVVCKEAFEKGIDCKNHYNFAIVGTSGQGKSSLINGLMGVGDGDENAANAGEVETTLDSKPYPHPYLKTVVLWDLPGGGTPKNPAETYFKDNMLHAFDALIIVTSLRFSQLDLEIAKQAAEAEVPVPVFFVRSKADQAIESKRRKNKNMTWEQAAEELQREVRESILGQLEEAGLTLEKLFVVSAWSLQDLMREMKTVQKEEPQDLEQMTKTKTKKPSQEVERKAEPQDLEQMTKTKTAEPSQAVEQKEESQDLEQMKTKGPSQEVEQKEEQLKLMDEIALISMLMEETMSRRT